MIENNNDDNFNIVGLPNLDDIEIEDPAPKKSSLTNKDDMNSMLKSLGLSDSALSDLMNKMEMNVQMFSAPNIDDLMSQFLSFIGGNKSSNSEEDSDDEDDPEKAKPVFFDTKWLYSQNIFGSVPCIESPTLKEDFFSRYGTDEKAYLTSGIKLIQHDDVSKTLPFELIETLEYCFNTDKYILFYAKPFKDEAQEEDSEAADFGFFMAAIKCPDNEFAFVLPEYGNTLYYDEETGSDLYSEDYAIKNFYNNGKLMDSLMHILNFSIKFMLIPIRKTLITPLQFGTIKNQKVPIITSSNWLQLGTITSNESPEAILLKKDADLSLSETTFPFYLKFNETINEDNLKLLQDVLFNINLNNSDIFKYSELRYTGTGELYIDIDLSDIA